MQNVVLRIYMFYYTSDLFIEPRSFRLKGDARSAQLAIGLGGSESFLRESHGYETEIASAPRCYCFFIFATAANVFASFFFWSDDREAHAVFEGP